MARGTTILIFGVLAAVLIAGAAVGGLFSVGGSYDGPECFTITPTSATSARFEARQSEECLQEYGAAPYQYRWTFDHFEGGGSDPPVHGPSPDLAVVEHQFPPLFEGPMNMGYFVYDSTQSTDPNQPCGFNCPYIELERLVLPFQYPPLQDPYTGNVTGSYTIGAAFSYGVSGNAVSLDMGASGGAPPYTFVIDWGDGETLNNTDGTESHAYTADGTYTIAMYAVDANGEQSDTTRATLTFQGGQCTAGCGGTSGAGIDQILIAQIALGIVAAILIVFGAIYRRLLMIGVGAGIAVFAFMLPLLV